MQTFVRRLSDQRKSALTAGISLMIMAAAAFFAFGYVHASLLEPGEPNTTLQNIISHHVLFRAEIFGWIIILICDILVTWSCYEFMKPINKSLSMLSAWLRLTYSAILGMAILNLVFILLLTDGDDALASMTSDQIGEQVMLYMQAFDSMWSIGLIVFGLHLLVLGRLSLKSDRLPKWISILLLFASIGYILIHLSKLFLAEYKAVGMILEYIFTVPMAMGETSLGIWLLFWGGKAPAVTR